MFIYFSLFPLMDLFRLILNVLLFFVHNQQCKKIIKIKYPQLYFCVCLAIHQSITGEKPYERDQPGNHFACMFTLKTHTCTLEKDHTIVTNCKTISDFFILKKEKLHTALATVRRNYTQSSDEKICELSL